MALSCILDWVIDTEFEDKGKIGILKDSDLYNWVDDDVIYWVGKV